MGSPIKGRAPTQVGYGPPREPLVANFESSARRRGESHLRLEKRVEHFAVQKFVAHLAVERIPPRSELSRCHRANLQRAGSQGGSEIKSLPMGLGCRPEGRVRRDRSRSIPRVHRELPGS